ncbi:MAG: zinc-ribbon domain-containing protein [Rhodobacteraceae bacterium]|nr:zinc-ribbon domain-containing protein [Paracoccaceae bacterium]
MRIVCPNCGAQYEVDEGAIPSEGRDVQCSSCGHSWFQIRPEPAQRSVPRAILPEDGPQEADADADADAHPGPSVEDGAAAHDSGAPEPDEDEVLRRFIDAPEPEPPQPAPPSEAHKPDPADGPGATVTRAARSGVDPAIAEILREEAEREARLRRGGDATPADVAAAAPAAPAEGAAASTASPGVDDDDEARRRRQRHREALARERRLAAENGAPAPATSAAPAPGSEGQGGGPAPAETVPEPILAAASDPASAEVEAGLPGPAPRRPERPARPVAGAGSRRDLLPDVDELNSTLRDVGEARPEGRVPASPAAGAPRNRRGFRRGFALTLLAIFLATLLYLRPDLVTAFVPEAAPALAAYGEAVGRLHEIVHERASGAADAVLTMVGRLF